jgi:hypothetical protein
MEIKREKTREDIFKAMKNTTLVLKDLKNEYWNK